MIGYLAGEIKYFEKGKIILFTNGIGFTVFVSGSLSYLLGDQVSLYIHTHMREDNLSLFGFSHPDELSLFEKLITVSGVGPRTALAIFTSASIENITKAISLGDLSFFTSIPGIGKKSAQKIILDLKSKISKGDIDISKLEGNSDLVDSLISLGFQKAEIQNLIPKIDPTLSVSDQIKSALKLLHK